MRSPTHRGATGTPPSATSQSLSTGGIAGLAESRSEGPGCSRTFECVTNGAGAPPVLYETPSSRTPDITDATLLLIGRAERMLSTTRNTRRFLRDIAFELGEQELAVERAIAAVRHVLTTVTVED